MTNRSQGIVDAVDAASVPSTNQAARRVLVNRDGAPQVCFFIPKDGPAPAYGDAIEWGPHHCHFNGQTVKKLTWALDPNAPIR